MRQGGLLFHRQYTLEMAAAGQLIRRELDLSGVEFKFRTAVSDKPRLERLQGQFAELVCEVLLVADQAAMAAGVNAKRKALESGARLFRLVRMFSFAVRVPTIVEEARQALAKGEKNFVVVDSTFEAALHDVNRRGLPKTFAGLVMREVECAREPGSGEESGTKRKVPLERFSDGGRRYRELMQRLATEVFDLPASPIDFIANELRRDGATVGEITGRKVEMKEVEGELELTPRGRQERNELLAQFNAGTLDALIVNRAGCNGISAHADPTFADQRRRVMIIGQEALDVNELMQMMGRVMRFGQTCEPRYVFVHTALALEQRAAGRLGQKLNGLNAHTRGDGDNEVTLTADLPPDLTDEHADVAVATVLRKEPEMARRMGVGVVPEGTRPKDGDAASATLRFALLPNRDAEDLCEQIEEELRVHNAPDSPGASGHRHQVEDLRAVVREEREWLPAPAGNALVPKVILSRVACTPHAAPVKYAQARGMVQSTVFATLQKLAGWTTAADQALLTLVAELEALDRPTDKVKARFAAVRAQLVLMPCALGATWWKGGDNEGGVAVGLHLRGEQPSDFTHASRQELELVVNSPLRRRRIPLSQLSPYKDQPVWTRVIDENYAAQMFDAGLNRPEERWIVTCGIIRGFSHALDVCTDSQRKPRLVEYSMQDGSIRIGVLMPKGFNPDAPIPERGATGAKRKKRLREPQVKLRNINARWVKMHLR